MKSETLSETRQRFDKIKKVADRLESGEWGPFTSWIAVREALNKAYADGRLQGLEEAAKMCDRWHGIYGDETAQRLADVIRKAIREKADG